MRFSSITISNYRQYRSLSLNFNSGAHDLHVIIGDNGTGKTNLLNAFTWCLYGTEPHLGIDDRKRGEPKLNKDEVRTVLENRKNESSIQVVIELENGAELDRIARTLPVMVRSTTDLLEMKSRETFVIQRISPRAHDQVLRDEAAQNYINRILDEKIREYFFFDGEQLSNYFADIRGDRIKAAIHSISQIDVVTTMRNRTDNSVKSLNKGLRRGNPDIAGIDVRIERYEKVKASAKRALEDYERQINSAKANLGTLSESLRGIPDLADLEQKRTSLTKSLQSCKDEVKNAREAYIAFARSAYIDFAFYDATCKTLEMVAGMESNHQLPPSIDRSYLKEMLDEGLCKVCGRPLSEHDRATMYDLLEQYRVSSQTTYTLMGMRSELRRLRDRVLEYPKRRNDVMSRLAFAEEKQTETERQLEEIASSLSKFSDPEKLKAMYKQRELLENTIETLNQRIGSKRRGLSEAQKDLDKARQERSVLLKKQRKQQDLASAVNFGDRAVRILNAVRKEVISEVRTRMAKRTEELFKGLVWKDSKCDHIILSDTYQLSLYDQAGYSCEGTCSAAERALLALSFTLAMHEVSGFDSPLFIDTPIARASGENRANFADTLADVSERKQLILTFTPDEYSETISSVFDPIAASRVRLTLDEAEQMVTVRSY